MSTKKNPILVFFFYESATVVSMRSMERKQDMCGLLFSSGVVHPLIGKHKQLAAWVSSYAEGRIMTDPQLNLSGVLYSY